MNDVSLLDKLEIALGILPEWVLSPIGWDSLIINRRKPETFRVFRQWGDYRVCLHRFSVCDDTESFIHPHPWPGAFKILHGSYNMKVGFANDLWEKPKYFEEFVLNTGAAYQIINPLTFHAITPLQTTYTVMINGRPFDAPHADIRTTSGKDLQRMSDTDLEYFLEMFRVLLEK